MTSPDQDNDAEPFFLTEDVVAELRTRGYEFAPPGHARTASARELLGCSAADDPLGESART